MMNEVELCFVTNRCESCPASTLGTKLGQRAIESAQAVLETLDNDPRQVIRVRIPGVGRLVAEQTGLLGAQDVDYHPIAEAARRIVWTSATSSCRPNFNRLFDKMAEEE